MLALIFALLLTSFLLPGHYMPWVSFQQEALAAACGVCACGSSVWRSKAPRVPLPASCVAIVGALLVARVMAADEFYLEDVTSLVFYAGVFSCCIVGAFNADRPRRLMGCIAAALTLAAVVSVVLQLFQWQSIHWLGLYMADLVPDARPYANLAQPNHLATLYCVALGGLWYLNQSRWLSRVSTGALALWLTAGLVMTESRTGLVAALLLMAGWAMLFGNIHGFRAAAWRALLGMLVATLMIWCWASLNDGLLLTNPDLRSSRMATGTRSVYWPVMLQATFVHPWMGWGWDHIAAAQQWMARGVPAGGEQLQSAHNIGLDLALAVGWPVTGVLALLSMRWLWQRRSLVNAEQGFAMAGIVVIGVHAMTEYPLRYLYFLVPLGFFIGLLSRPAANIATMTGYADRSTACSSVVRGGLIVALLLLTALGLRLAWEYLQVEEAERDDRFTLARIGDWERPVSKVPGIVLLDGWQDLHEFRFTQARTDMTPAQLSAMRRIADRWPYPPVLFRYALAQALNGDPENARSNLRALCHTQAPPRCMEAAESWNVARGRYHGIPEFPVMGLVGAGAPLGH